MFSMGRALALSLLALSLAACGGGNDSPTPSIVAPEDAGAVFRPDFVTVKNLGGPIIAHPEVWTVAWSSNSAFGKRMYGAVRTIAETDYLPSGLSEYGVGKGIAKPFYEAPGDPPSSRDYLEFDDVADGLADALGQTANPSAIFVLVLPKQTQVTLNGARYCDAAQGTHFISAKGTKYAIIPDCGGGDRTAFYISHEISETATDPSPVKAPAWQSLEPGAEVSDLCGPLGTDVVDPVEGTTWTLQRNYSTKAAALGTVDPCIPAPDGLVGAAFAGPRVQIGAKTGSEATAELVLFSSSPETSGNIAWEVAAQGVEITPNRGTGLPGTRVTLHLVSQGYFPSGGFVTAYAISRDDTKRYQFIVSPIAVK